jgi:hypothetical protein
VTRGQTFFVTGPPGCGKTTTAMLWSLRRPRPTFTLDWDTVRGVVVQADQLRGHASGDVSSQYRLAARALAAWAGTTTATGVDCVITGARVPSQPTDPVGWRHTWTDLDVLDPITIVLLPLVDVCVERNRADRARVGPFAVPEVHVRASYEFAWDAWRDRPRAVVIDTSEMSQEEVVASLDDWIAPLL